MTLSKLNPEKILSAKSKTNILQHAPAIRIATIDKLILRSQTTINDLMANTRDHNILHNHKRHENIIRWTM
jgi:hypothetical protein